jgi:hypothetical protein
VMLRDRLSLPNEGMILNTLRHCCCGRATALCFMQYMHSLLRMVKAETLCLGAGVEGSPASMVSGYTAATPSQTGDGSAHHPWSERRQRQREASAEALASEYERSEDSGYEEVPSCISFFILPFKTWATTLC